MAYLAGSSMPSKTRQVHCIAQQGLLTFKCRDCVNGSLKQIIENATASTMGPSLARSSFTKDFIFDSFSSMVLLSKFLRFFPIFQQILAIEFLFYWDIGICFFQKFITKLVLNSSHQFSSVLCNSQQPSAVPATFNNNYFQWIFFRFDLLVSW